MNFRKPLVAGLAVAALMLSPLSAFAQEAAAPEAPAAASAAARDVIADFSREQDDKIELSAIDANQRLSGDQAFNFIGAKGFSGSAGELRYQHDNGVTLIFADTNGDQLTDFSVELAGQITLLGQDFLL